MLVDLLVLLVIAGVIYAVGLYVLPEPAKKVATIVAVVIAVLALVNFLLMALGHSALVPLHIS